jgi:hypothetical protein
MPGSPRKPTRVSFKGSKEDFPTSIDAYIWLIKKFLGEKPDLLDDVKRRNEIALGRGKQYFARASRELYAKSPHLAEEGHFRPIGGGWLVGTNLNNNVKLQVLHQFSKFTGISDWTWDAGDGERGPASAVLDLD